MASFYGSPTTGNVPLTVSFTDVSSNSPTSWNWSMGDGTYSEAKNPTHCWSGGTYTVALNASTAYGYSTNSTTVRVY